MEKKTIYWTQNNGVTPLEEDQQEPVSSDLQVLSRCAAVLRLLSASTPSISVQDVRNQVGLQRTTAIRYLNSLVAEGFLRKREDGSYVPGPLLAHLAAVAKGSFRVLDVAPSWMQRLREEIQETVVLSVWSGIGAVVARVDESTNRVAHVAVRVGSILSLDAAQTQLFLAHLREPEVIMRLMSSLPVAERKRYQEQLIKARSEGFALWSESAVGFRILAVPILDDENDICASLAIIGPSHRISSTIHDGNGILLAATAREISSQLGNSKIGSNVRARIGGLDDLDNPGGSDASEGIDMTLTTSEEFINAADGDQTVGTFTEGPNTDV